MKEKLNKFRWVRPFVIYGYFVFLAFFLGYTQLRIHKLETYNEELSYAIDDVLDEVAEEFARIERNIIKLDKQINDLENELINQQEHSAELLEDYYALLAERDILKEKLKQAKEIYTEEDIRYAIDIFAEYLVEYPPNGTVCVYEKGTLLIFKIVNDELVFDEMLSYNDLKDLWFNK